EDGRDLAAFGEKSVITASRTPYLLQLQSGISSFIHIWLALRGLPLNQIPFVISVSMSPGLRTLLYNQWTQKTPLFGGEGGAEPTQARMSRRLDKANSLSRCSCCALDRIEALLWKDAVNWMSATPEAPVVPVHEVLVPEELFLFPTVRSTSGQVVARDGCVYLQQIHCSSSAGSTHSHLFKEVVLPPWPLDPPLFATSSQSARVPSLQHSCGGFGHAGNAVTPRSQKLREVSACLLGNQEQIQSKDAKEIIEINLLESQGESDVHSGRTVNPRVKEKTPDFTTLVSSLFPALFLYTFHTRLPCELLFLGPDDLPLSTTGCLPEVTPTTGRPVRCVLERGEDMLITGGRHPVWGKYKASVFLKKYYANSGNTADESVLVAEKILLHLDNAYSIPNLRGRSAACKTHLPSNTAFRGFGVPQCMLVVESMIDDVALKLGRLPEEIREINMYKEVSLTHYKMEFDPENLTRCWNECMEKSEFSRRRQAVQLFNQQNQFKKRGIAIIPIKYGIGFAESFLNQAAALVHIYKDGSVLVSHGGAEMGQGIHTKIQQVASRELIIPASLIHISETSTQCVPNTCPSAASFGTGANGMAVQDACQKLYNRLEPIRKKHPKGTWQDWVTTAFLEKISLSATGYYRGQDLDMDWEKQEGRPYAYFTYGACCSEVELDCLNGEYRTLRTDIVVDIGRSINPSIDIGQIEGAFMQGLGLYTMEELKFSPSGVLYTRGPGQYKIPAVCDVPLKFNVYLLSGSSNPHAIYSSKGIGEPTLFLGSSVFFAIKDAVAASRKNAGLTGPFQLNSPATPERACLACATSFTKMSSQAILIFSAVAGEEKEKLSLSPLSFRAAVIASLMAKNKDNFTSIVKNTGSSASVQLIDPLHIDAGQSLPLSDWNVRIRNGSDGFQAGPYGEGSFPIVHDGAVVFEVVGHIWRDIIPVDADVLVAIAPGVLMVESQSMIELMLNDPSVHTACPTERDHLLATKASIVQADESISGLGEQQISLDQDFRRTCGSREMLWNRYIFYPQILVTQVLNSMVCGVGMNERRDQTGTYLERRSQGDANQQQQNGEVSQVHVSSVFSDRNIKFEVQDLFAHSDETRRRCRSAGSSASVQLIDPLHINDGQSLPLSDWNIGIRNGSDGFQAGLYGEGSFPVVHDGAVVFKVVGHIWRDIIPVDADVLVAIAPGVLMVESQSMIELMLNDPSVHTACPTERDHLLATKASVVQADESISGLGEQQISLDQDFRRTCGSREMLWNRYIFYPQILVTQVLNSMVCGVGMNERRDQTGTYLERRSQGDANQQQQNGEVSQLIDPLHVNAGQSLPLSDWNVGIRNGSDGFQAGPYGKGGVPVVHDGAVVVCSVLVVGVFEFEVVGHIWRDVIPVDADVLVAIAPGVLMVESQSMIELMLNDPSVHTA
ncbi:hypothetical protein DNTS_017772, partial [Danionella cerebrum]